MHPSLTYLRVLEVVSPQRSDLVLATHVPNSEADVLIFYGLHVETFTGAREDKALDDAIHKTTPSENDSGTCNWEMSSE